MPGTVHIQIRGQLRSELGQNFLSVERISEGVVVEILHHLVGNDDGILRLPRFRAILQNAELNRKATGPALDVGIHAARVGVKVRAIAGTRHL